VRILIERTAKGRSTHFLPGKELYRALWEKAKHGIVICRA
jgi:hypothetical protein